MERTRRSLAPYVLAWVAWQATFVMMYLEGERLKLTFHVKSCIGDAFGESASNAAHWRDGQAVQRSASCETSRRLILHGRRLRCQKAAAQA